MALRSLKRMAERRSLQAATSKLGRFSDDLRQSRKTDGWSPRQVVREHRDDVALALAAIEPILTEHLQGCVQADREVEAAKAEAGRSGGHAYFAPSARIGESAAPKHDAAGELEAFKAEVAFAISTAPTGQVARERVAALLAKEGVLAAFRSKR